ncbi:MAG: Hsp20/alpha crystallin family protein [Myxococcota bacterium]
MTTLLVPRRGALARPGFGDIDRLFDDFWRGFGAPLARRAEGSDFAVPRMDVAETDEAFELHAEMPGLEEKDIEVSVEDGVLTVRGRREEKTDEEKDGFRHVETYRGSFHRAVKLPAEVDEDGISAGYKNGILTVKLPKIPEPEPQVRQVPVSTS